MTAELVKAPPQDGPAEMAVLGACLMSQSAAELMMSRLVGTEFYHPAHRQIFEAVKAVAKAGIPVDPNTVHAWLAERGMLLAVGGGKYLIDLMQACPTVANAEHYAGIVRDRAVRRRLIEAGVRISQRAAAAQGDQIAELTEDCLREIQAVRDFEMGDEVTTPTVAEFLDESESEYDWLVPDLLERGDRLVLTSRSRDGSGVGKSTLLRQLAVTMAAGLHPFKHYDVPPMKVMLVDCENPRRHVKRKMRPLTAQARLLKHDVVPTRLWIESRPDGLDLMADSDVSWLLRRVVLINPDVVIIGPLYKLCPRAMNTDDEASPVIAALNQVRAHGAALIVEAHAGLAGGLNPRGSSAFSNWPEFGYGLKEVSGKGRVVDFLAWRGPRDERSWPERLEAGGDWPWREVQTWHDAWTPHAVLDGVSDG